MYRRANARWTINECLRLEREYDLLKLSIEEIAELHERSPNAIMYKLDAEGLADYNDAYQNRRQKLQVDTNDEDEDEDNDDAASENSGSEYDEECEDDDSASEYNEDEDNHDNDNKYDTYNLRQQINYLTKQVSNLTKIVYSAFTSKSKSGEFNSQSFAGFH